MYLESSAWTNDHICSLMQLLHLIFASTIDYGCSSQPLQLPMQFPQLITAAWIAHATSSTDHCCLNCPCKFLNWSHLPQLPMQISQLITAASTAHATSSTDHSCLNCPCNVLNWSQLPQLPMQLPQLITAASIAHANFSTDHSCLIGHATSSTDHSCLSRTCNFLNWSQLPQLPMQLP
jgi:hypothetical protein